VSVIDPGDPVTATVPASDLAGLYGRWRELTEAEAAAIQARDWTQLANVQTRKTHLQAQIAPLDSSPQDPRLLPIVGELIRLERANLAQLARCLTAAREEENALDRSARNLRQIHRSYRAEPRLPAGRSFVA
jgi:hypothetical protein